MIAVLAIAGVISFSHRSGEGALTRSGQVGPMTYSLKFRWAPFAAKGHRIEQGDTSKSHPGLTVIDGRIAWGAGGLIPKRQLVRINVCVGPKSLVVPSSLTEDCFEFDDRLGGASSIPAERDAIERWIDPRSGVLSFAYWGADAGASYEAVYRIDPSGETRRTIYVDDKVVQRRHARGRWR